MIKNLMVGWLYLVTLKQENSVNIHFNCFYRQENTVNSKYMLYLKQVFNTDVL